MDEHAIPSGLAELEQLHVEPNSEHSTLLHTEMMKSWAGPGYEARVQASGAVRACSTRVATYGAEQ